MSIVGNLLGAYDGLLAGKIKYFMGFKKHNKITPITYAGVPKFYNTLEEAVSDLKEYKIEGPKIKVKIYKITVSEVQDISKTFK